MTDAKLEKGKELEDAITSILENNDDYESDTDEENICKRGNILKIFWCIWLVDTPLFRNKRFQRAMLAGMSVMLGFAGWLVFLFEYIEFDPSVSAWVPGIMSTLGFVALNLVYIPEDDGSRGLSAMGVYTDGRMTPAEMFFVASIAWTMFPVVISIFILAIDYKHDSEHTVAISLFFQTTCILVSAIAFMGARSMDVRPKKNDDEEYMTTY